MIDARGFAQELNPHGTLVLAAVGGKLLQHLGAVRGRRRTQQVHMGHYIELLARLLRSHRSPQPGEQGRPYQKKSLHRWSSYRLARGDAMPADRIPDIVRDQTSFDSIHGSAAVTCSN